MVKVKKSPKEVRLRALGPREQNIEVSIVWDSYSFEWRDGLPFFCVLSFPSTPLIDTFFLDLPHLHLVTSLPSQTFQ